ncbi:hypothetical protein [Pseudidiomarina insulisalsae]|uniref:CBS domain-containing protein n=1 Tax=Pseudidiomarina insulisalsae TaxID=575789 RepID=A0A432YH60_9GAMM|nr:hypothetical protein [Pseudidiomarina insulisalsae]RUO60278.1 hypothetical protein CWI71_07680 [Pseudidiomarina insulisalsae]
MANFHALNWHQATTGVRLSEATAQQPARLSWHHNAKIAVEYFQQQSNLLTESTRLPEAEQKFEKNGSRYVCVLDTQKNLSGILSSRELHSRHTGALSSALQLPWSQIEVRHLMQPITRLPVIDKAQLERAKIGDIAATMQAAGRDFVLVEEQGQLTGFIAALKILALTGESVRLYPRASTFAEVFTALKHPEITDS